MSPRWHVQLSAVLAAAALLWTAAAAAPPRRTGPDSFLRYRVNTVDQLVRQVESDAVVRARLANHFHVSQAELVRYLRDNLVVHTVSASGYYTVYGVTEKTGRIYPTRQYFRKGEKIFSLRDGSPLLKFNCGNPVTGRLPAVTEPLAPPLPPSATGPGPVEEEQVAGALEAEAPAPEVTPMGGLPPSPVEERVAAAPRETRNIIPILVAGGLVPIVIGGHSPPVIPEPATIALLACGLAAFAFIVWRERRAAAARSRIR
jgi:hypothetical protein